MDTTEQVRRPHGIVERYVALSLWLLVFGVFFSVAKQWVEFTSADKQLTEYVDSLIQRVALDRRSQRDVRILVMSKAEQLSIPVQREQISISGEGKTLRTTINYNAEIKIPVVEHVLYRMEFSHIFANKSPW